jgi:hydroxymethylbilane synthase
VKRIERALIEGEIDLAVHSLKDVPTQLEDGLVLAAVPERGDPRDALVLPAGVADALPPGQDPVEALPRGARIGTGSSRRATQLLRLRPDLELRDVRGNVDTRLRKLDAGELDGLILAAAGLERLGRADRISRRLDPDELTPMVGQGALAIEARADDREALGLAEGVDHQPTRACVEAERAFLRRLGGGCTLPVGALATLDGDELFLRVVVADGEGERIVRRAGRAPVGAGLALAADLADQALAALPSAAALRTGERPGQR